MLFNHLDVGPLGRPPLDETRCKEVLIKKESVSFNTYRKYQENQRSIKRTREIVTPRLGTVELCPSKYYIERSQGQCKK